MQVSYITAVLAEESICDPDHHKGCKQVFWLYGLSGTGYFRKSVQTIMILVNFLTNLIFALAVLWMQEKRSLSLGFETFEEQPQASRSI